MGPILIALDLRMATGLRNRNLLPRILLVCQIIMTQLCQTILIPRHATGTEPLRPSSSLALTDLAGNPNQHQNGAGERLGRQDTPKLK